MNEDSVTHIMPSAPHRLAATMTEITLAGGDHVRVDGDAKDIEAAILAADRGSIMEFAWMIESKTGHRVGVNPNCVVMLRAIEAADGPT